MSPFSGITYGLEQDWGQKLDNRVIFEQIQSQLNEQAVEKLLYSINPATRLLAIEYYLEHKSQFTKQKQIEARIENIYQMLPLIKTYQADIITREPAEKLVAYVIEKKKPVH